MFRPMNEAIGVVNANQRRITTGLKASGGARGFFTDDSGKKRHFDLDARLQVVLPTHMRFVMKSVLGGDELEVGMNDDKWWLVVQRPQDTYIEGRRGDPGVTLSGAVPLRAEQLMESLGLSPLNASGAAQRIVDNYQQILFVSHAGDRNELVKEYWLDRYEPWLVRRVVFRDDEGRTLLTSELGAYRRAGGSGVMLPHEVRLTWSDEAELVFHVRRWESLDTLTGAHRAFVSPYDRGKRFTVERRPRTGRS
jgi:hypothetical protein